MPTNLNDPKIEISEDEGNIRWPRRATTPRKGFRQQAVKQIKKKRNFHVELVVCPASAC